MATRQGALQSLAEFAQSMRDEGIVTNPYCRFPLSTMQAATPHPSLSPYPGPSPNSNSNPNPSPDPNPNLNPNPAPEQAAMVSVTEAVAARDERLQA